jgi:ribosome-associated protein
MEQRFAITDEYIELNKLLKASGLCDTGGQAKAVIAERLVTVDGVVETRTRRKVRSGMVVAFRARSMEVHRSSQ